MRSANRIYLRIDGRRLIAALLIFFFSLTFAPGLRAEAHAEAEEIIYPQLLPQVARAGVEPLQLDLSDLELGSPNVIIREFFGDGTYRDYHRELASDTIYPASMTKMMSVLVILRELRKQGIPLQETVEVIMEDVQGLAAAGASIMGLLIGELIPIREALYGVLLPSGSDALRVLHRVTIPDEGAFVQEMNNTAAALGMVGTHFANSTGLFDPYNYATPEDMTLLLHCLLQDPLFREICGTREYTTPPTNMHGEGIELHHTIHYYGDKLGVDNSSITGGKTGWLPQAGYCFTSFRTFGDRLIIVSTERAKEAGEQISDHAKIYRYLENNLPALPDDVFLPSLEARWATKLTEREAAVETAGPLKPPQVEHLSSETASLDMPILETLGASEANDYMRQRQKQKNLKTAKYIGAALLVLLAFGLVRQRQRRRRRYRRPKRL